MRSDKMSSYRCCGSFLAESITLKNKHGIQVLNETPSKSLSRSNRRRSFWRPQSAAIPKLAQREIRRYPGSKRPRRGSLPSGLDLWILPNFLDLPAS